MAKSSRKLKEEERAISHSIKLFKILLQKKKFIILIKKKNWFF